MKFSLDLQLFLSLLFSELQKSHNSPDLIKDPMSTMDFCYIPFLNNISEETHNKYRTTSNPSYELDKNIDTLTMMLKDLYPQYYDTSLLIRSSYLVRPKKGSLKDRQKGFRVFDLETEATD